MHEIGKSKDEMSFKKCIYNCLYNDTISEIYVHFANIDTRIHKHKLEHLL